LVFLMASCFARPAFAQSQVPDQNQAPVPSANDNGGSGSDDGGDGFGAVQDPTAVDEVHQSIAAGVTGVGDWVDGFFGTDHDHQENKKSRVRVSMGGFTETGRNPGFRLKVSARLALPRTGERLSLLVGGDGDNDSEPANTKADNAEESHNGTDQENAAVGLQYFLVSSKKRNLSALVGLRIKTSGPVGVFGGRYRETLGLGDQWDLRFTQSAVWLTDNGFALPTSFDLDRPITESVLSRTTLQGAWYESKSGYFYGANQWFMQRIDDKRGIRYEWNNAFRTAPRNRLQETNFRVDYRQKFWREWLLFEVAPQLSLPRHRDYKLTPGIYAGIQIRFGG